MPHLDNRNTELAGRGAHGVQRIDPLRGSGQSAGYGKQSANRADRPSRLAGRDIDTLAETLGPEPRDGGDDALIGRCLDGRYQLIERIGRGAYGRVYRAEQVALSRSVAVKVIGPLGPRGDLLARSLEDEAYAASRLHHPNVVAIHDYGQTADGLLYLAMEYVEGETLTRLIAREGPLAPMRAVRIVRQILAALRAAHAAGIVHADLKCDNTLVEVTATGEQVKVIDFGIARMLNGARAVDTGEPLLAGTPHYMAPEVIQGHPPTEPSDLYAVGVILYQLLTGTPPFQGATALEVLHEHVHAPVEPPSRRAARLAIPGVLDRVALTAMAKDPADRFADAASFLDALVGISGEYQAVPDARARAEDSGAVRVEASALDRRAIDSVRASAERAFARGATGRAIELLREAIGMAIRVGNAVHALECYLALADALDRLRVHLGALAELDEAASLLDTGDTAPREIWRLHLMRAQLCARLRRPDDAEAAAAKALAHAQRVFAIHGSEHAAQLLVHLRAGRPRARR